MRLDVGGVVGGMVVVGLVVCGVRSEVGGGERILAAVGQVGRSNRRMGVPGRVPGAAPRRRGVGEQVVMVRSGGDV